MSRSRRARHLTGPIALAACAVLLLAASPDAQGAETFKLSNNHRITCSRALAPGKMQTVGCRSHAYVMNTATSEFYRCEVSIEIMRDSREIKNTSSSGRCVSRGRMFSTDSNYTFDATETEPPNTNAFFGSGGMAIWVSDTTARKVRGCIDLATGIGDNVLQCVDMEFDH
jgi:hypothetical protein